MITSPAQMITETDFVEVWGASTKPDGNLFQYNEIRDIRESLIWTVYESEERCKDGCYLHWLAMPDVVPSVALGYLIAKRDWVDDTPHAIWFEDDDKEAARERDLEAQN
jgi:hypothetical protein